jgi:hypothetical protein
MQRSSPRVSSQTLRPGIIVLSDQGEYWEYLGRFHQRHVSVRQWQEASTNGGRFLTPSVQSNTYMGAAGTNCLRGLNRLRFEKAIRVNYRYIHPNKIEIMGTSERSIANGLLQYPQMSETGTPWMIQLKQILHENGFPPNAMCYTDGTDRTSIQRDHFGSICITLKLYRKQQQEWCTHTRMRTGDRNQY